MNSGEQARIEMARHLAGVKNDDHRHGVEARLLPRFRSLWTDKLGHQ